MEQNFTNVLNFLQELLEIEKQREFKLKQENLNQEQEINVVLSNQKPLVQNYLKKKDEQISKAKINQEEEVQQKVISSLEQQIEETLKKAQIQIEELNEDSQQKKKQSEKQLLNEQQKQGVSIKSTPRQSLKQTQQIQERIQPPKELTEKEILEQKKPAVFKQNIAQIPKVGNPKNQSSAMQKALGQEKQQPKKIFNQVRSNSQNQKLNQAKTQETVKSGTAKQEQQKKNIVVEEKKDIFIQQQIEQKQRIENQSNNFQPEKSKLFQQQSEKEIDLFEKNNKKMQEKNEEIIEREIYLIGFQKGEIQLKDYEEQQESIKQLKETKKNLQGEINQYHANEKYFRDRIQQSKFNFGNRLAQLSEILNNQEEDDEIENEDEDEEQQEDQNNKESQNQLNEKQKQIEKQKDLEEDEFFQEIMNDEELVVQLTLNQKYQKIFEKFKKECEWEINNIENVMNQPDQYDITQIFRIWYFCSLFKQNFDSFHEQVQLVNEAVQEKITQSKQIFKRNFNNKNLDKQSENQNSKINIPLNKKQLQFEIFDKCQVQIDFQNSIENKNLEIERLNQSIFHNTIHQLVFSILKEKAFPQINQILNANKIEIEKLKKILKDIQSLISLGGYRGKIVPSIFLTEQLQQYTEQQTKTLSELKK